MSTFGKTSAGGTAENLWPHDYTYAFKYTAPENGMITKLSIIGGMRVGTATAKMAVYSVVGGTITSRLAISSAVSLNTTIQTWDFPLSLSIISGVEYAFAFGECDTDMDFVNTYDATAVSLNYCTGLTIPATWTQSGSWGNEHPVFATYTPATLDQHQDSTGSSFGFGEIASMVSRGQVFTCGINGSLAVLGFDRTKGSKDVKVYIDTASANVPDHTRGNELYSWIIPNADVIDQYGEYAIPIPPTLVSGTKYCFYLEPYSGGSYSDDYADCHGVASGSVEISDNGPETWFNENLTFKYATYIVETAAILYPPRKLNLNGGVNTRPRAFSPGFAR